MILKTDDIMRTDRCHTRLQLFHKLSLRAKEAVEGGLGWKGRITLSRSQPWITSRHFIVGDCDRGARGQWLIIFLRGETSKYALSKRAHTGFLFV